MKKALLLALIAFAIFATSCNHKELCYLHPHITTLRVEFDWSEAPDDAYAAGMRVFFYPEDASTSHYYFDFVGMQGGQIELPAGKYRVIAYNNDTEASHFASCHDFDAHYCYTREGNILEPIYGNGMRLPNRNDDSERVVITPDELYISTLTELEISPNGVTYTHIHNYDEEGRIGQSELISSSEQVITLFPRDVLCHYSYEVRNVSNLKHVSLISAALSGMAPGIDLNCSGLHTEPVTLPVAATHDGQSTVTGEFLTFGHHDDNPDPHRMSFYVVMDDGTKYQFTTGDRLDVTDQVHSAPNRRRVHIIIDGLDIPEAIEYDSPFSPDIDNWGVIESDIHI